MSDVLTIALASEAKALGMTQPKFEFGQRVLFDGEVEGVVTGMCWIAPNSFWSFNNVKPGWLYTVDFPGEEPCEVRGIHLQAIATN
jgi:hypothetical protein